LIDVKVGTDQRAVAIYLLPRMVEASETKVSED
jgi:hypothetical protein